MRTNSLTQFYLSIICDLTSWEIFRCLRNNIQHTQFSKEVLLLVYWPDSTSQRRDGLWTGLVKVAVTWRLLRVISLITPPFCPPPPSIIMNRNPYSIIPTAMNIGEVVVKIRNKTSFLIFHAITSLWKNKCFMFARKSNYKKNMISLLCTICIYLYFKLCMYVLWSWTMSL